MPAPYGQSDIYGPDVATTWLKWQPYNTWAEAARDFGLEISEVGDIHHQDMFRIKDDLISDCSDPHNFCMGPRLISRPLEDIKIVKEKTNEQPIFL